MRGNLCRVTEWHHGSLLEGEGRAAEALGRRAGPAADDLMRVHDGRRRPQGAGGSRSSHRQPQIDTVGK